MINKIMNRAMTVLYKEQKRRSRLPIRNQSYINEIKIIRKLLRKLYRKLALFKPKAGKYPVLLTEEQINEIEDFYEWKVNVSFPGPLRKNIGQDYQNFKSQIRTLKGESNEPPLYYSKVASKINSIYALDHTIDKTDQAAKDIPGNSK